MEMTMTWNDGASKVIGKYEKNLSNTELSKKLNKAVQILRKSVLQNFDEQGRPDKWLPSLRVLNRKKYQSMKHRANNGRDLYFYTGEKGGKYTLQKHGLLYDSIKPVINFPEGKVVCYSKYGRLMNNGGSNNKGYNIPKRPFMMFQDEDIKAINNIFIEAIK